MSSWMFDYAIAHSEQECVIPREWVGAEVIGGYKQADI